MKRIIITAILLIPCVAWAVGLPIYPATNDENMKTVSYNFINLVATQEILLAGASSYTISPISFDTNSVVIGTLNTATGQYVKSIVIGDNEVTVNLDTTLSATAEVSIMGVTKR